MQKKVKRKVPKKIQELIKKKRAVILDVGCGSNKSRPDALGMDVRPLKGVDIVHNINTYPWPIPDESCQLVTASHVLEHIPKWGTIPQLGSLVQLLIKKGVMSQNEANKAIGETEIFSYLMRFLEESWRVLKTGGQLAMSLPYAASSGYYQDPTHCSQISEATWFYFDPEHVSGLWNIYKPKPWEIQLNTYQVNGFMEILLKKRPLEKKYENDEEN